MELNGGGGGGGCGGRGGDDGRDWVPSETLWQLHCTGTLDSNVVRRMLRLLISDLISSISFSSSSVTVFVDSGSGDSCCVVTGSC